MFVPFRHAQHDGPNLPDQRRVFEGHPTEPVGPSRHQQVTSHFRVKAMTLKEPYMWQHIVWNIFQAELVREFAMTWSDVKKVFRLKYSLYDPGESDSC